ncbi:SCO7613 C-terminal domain-containing membrane protein [Streptomyces sp. NPDC088762]|uniref:SCO7613 C-terminal domain-containing membrane protein n=1 Tax=Streptomyces sp. NPDC088762 TaxID=3365891 RepID=UPI0038081B5B
MNTPLPPAEELALIDRELAQLDARRLYLLGRRDWLLRLPTAPVWAPPGPAASAPSAQETSPPGAQNVLLALGAVLLAVAALAFTLLSWGSLGIAGRSAVLAAVTAAALAVPAVLLRRGLRSTAESVAAVGMLLTVLDAYALHAVGLPGIDGPSYASGAAAVLAAVWAAYGAGLRKLRIPLPAAVLAAQFPLPLAALAAQAGPLEIGWSLLATAALDAALALRVRAAAVPAAVLGAGALLTGAAESWSAGSAGEALAPAGLLLAAAALGVVAARREPRVWAAATAGGLAAVVALGGVARQGLDPAWTVVVHLLVALPLLAVVRVRALSAPVRRGLAGAGAAVAALAALAGCSAAAPALLSRVRVLGEVWASTTPAADPYWPGAAVPLTLLITAGAGWWLSRALSRPEPAVAAVVLAWAGLFTAPELLGFPVAAVFAVQSAVTAAVGVLALRATARGAGFAAAGCALAGAANVSLGALDGRAATFAVWGALGACCAAGAAYGPAVRAVRAGAAVCAVGYASVLSAAGAAAELPVAWWALPVLVVPAAVAALGPRLGEVRVPAELAAVASGVAALALSAGRTGTLASALGLAGVICAGAAVREDRRVPGGWAAGALFVAATWVRLADSGVTVPEAYTLPVTVPALAVGFLRRRRELGGTPAATSSWTAYGPGLSATLLPSLLAVLGGSAAGTGHWLRPLLLGLAALLVTLAGARHRLQAPLVLGGAVLAAVALHELAPYVVQVAGALPRWVPPALAGLLLLAVGATYEKRLRDARRLRDALGRLR